MLIMLRELELILFICTFGVTTIWTVRQQDGRKNVPVSDNSRPTGNCESLGRLLKAVPLPLRFTDSRMQCSRHLPPPVPQLLSPQAAVKNRTVSYLLFSILLQSALQYVLPFIFLLVPSPQHPSSTYDFFEDSFCSSYGLSLFLPLAASAFIQTGTFILYVWLGSPRQTFMGDRPVNCKENGFRPP